MATSEEEGFGTYPIGTLHSQKTGDGPVSQGYRVSNCETLPAGFC
jgi:hypothetical protein